LLDRPVPAPPPFTNSPHGWSLSWDDERFAWDVPEDMVSPWLDTLERDRGLDCDTTGYHVVVTHVGDVNHDPSTHPSHDPSTNASNDASNDVSDDVDILGYRVVRHVQPGVAEVQPPLFPDADGVHPPSSDSIERAPEWVAQGDDRAAEYAQSDTPDVTAAGEETGNAPGTGPSTDRPDVEHAHVTDLLANEHLETESPFPAVVAESADTPVSWDGEQPGSTDAGEPCCLLVLGPVELQGATRTPTRTGLHLLTYLALHRRGVDADRLATALWPDRSVTPGALRNRVGEARASVGGRISEGPNRRLSPEVSSDWELFQQLAVGDTSSRQQALRLVRGRPFDGLPDAEWLDLEGFRTEIEAQIIECAVRTATDLLAAGAAMDAFHASRAGLHANPYEERLFRLAMEAAKRQGSTGLLRTLARELHVVLGEDAHALTRLDSPQQP
jgi:DNA-binding SARP family transcriptional activator